jgi:L-alanine-DL-glutamate epimerase-like enolase superfamily enzyme
MSKIARIDTILLDIPFDDFYDRPRTKPRGWTQRDTLLVKVVTDDGIIGWGESFAYACRTATRAAVRDMFTPRLIGQDCSDIAGISREMQRQLHIQGRYGITIFAWSGIEMALWDIAAKREGVSLARLLGGRKRDVVPAYASLVRYGEVLPVAHVTETALRAGYTDVKLHEIALDTISAARDAGGRAVRLTTDVNCNWSLAQCEELLPRMKALDLYWVEEPIFPPEDFETLAALEKKFGVALATGENACTSFQFKGIVPAVTFVQPSVTKIGGILEFIKAAEMTKAAGKVLMPHCPYSGPGWWASLQLAAFLPEIGMLEHLYIQPKNWVGRDYPLPQNSMVAIPDAPGLGFEPDPIALQNFTVTD